MLFSFLIYIQLTGNFKAVYQRARAHSALCNEDEARRDLATVEKLDPTFKPFVRQELKKLGESIRKTQAHQNKTYWDMTQDKWGPGGSKAKAAAAKVQQKNARLVQKDTAVKRDEHEKTEGSPTEQKQSSEEPGPTEADGVDDAEDEPHPEGKTQQGNKEQAGERAGKQRLDDDNTPRAVVQEDGQGARDKPGADTERDPAATAHAKIV